MSAFFISAYIFEIVAYCLQSISTCNYFEASARYVEMDGLVRTFAGKVVKESQSRIEHFPRKYATLFMRTLLFLTSTK